MAYNPKDEEQKIGKVEGTEGVQKTNLDNISGDEEIKPSKTKFDDAMVKANESVERMKEADSSTAVQGAKRPTPMEEIKPVQGTRPVDPAAFERFTNDTTRIEGVIKASTERLSNAIDKTPTLQQGQLGAEYTNPLSQRLTHVDSLIKSANSIVGVEAKASAAQPAPAGTHPLKKFLNYLTSSDQQMGTLVNEVKGLQSKGQLSITQLTALQMKMNLVTQQLEFFSNALNQALNALKTIMNVQV